MSNNRVPLIQGTNDELLADYLENGTSKDHHHSRESFRKAYHLSVPTKETLLSSQINLYVEEHKPKIPDGGWGWLVVLSCLFINLVSDGVGSTFGILNMEFLNEFNASNSATSFIGSLFLSVPLLAGPLGSAMVDKYGCKYMTILGSLICTTGFVISAYVKSIWMLYITFGFIGGIGFCLCYVTAVVSIAFWFEKRRTLALSIAASGTGFGTVIYSPLITYLTKEYGWRGSMLIMAGLCANMIISGLLMKDPDWIKQDQRAITENEPPKPSNTPSKKKYKFENGKAAKLPSGRHCTSMIELPTFLPKQKQQLPLEALKHLSEQNKLRGTVFENLPKTLAFKSASDMDLHVGTHPVKGPVSFSNNIQEGVLEGCPFGPSEGTISDEHHESGNIIPKLVRSHSTKSHRSDSLSHNYLHNIRFNKHSMGYRGAMLNLHKYKLAASSCPDILKNSMLMDDDDEEDEWYDDYVDVLKDITNLSLFNELHFFLLGVSTIIMCIWFVVPYFYLPVHMTLSGYTENQASFALSLIGFTNIAGMLSFGIIGDKLNAVKVYSICLMCCGVTCAAMMYFTDNYVMLLISCGFFGIAFASVNTLTPSILADLVPLDNFTMAYGLFLLCQGIGNLAGPPIAGLLYDITSTYEQSFYQAGMWVVLSGVIVGLIPYVPKTKIFGNGALINIC